MLIYSYKFGSASAKALSRAISARRIKHTNSRFRGRRSKVVINWGASQLPQEVMKCEIINNPVDVGHMADKRVFFQKLSQKPLWGERGDWQSCLVPHTESLQEAQEWCHQGQMVVCRTVLNGHSGRGIVLSRTAEELVQAPLYTMYKKKANEYRVHVGSSGLRIICIQRKARRREFEEPNWQIRSHANGFVFARNEDHPVPGAVKRVAKQALVESGLEFGAVDVIFNDREEKAYVLEINTAPGLEGETVQDYVRYFTRART